MAEYVVALGHNGVEPFTTTPGQVDTIRFEENVDRVIVTSNGQGEVRVTNGGTEPSIGQPGSSTIAFRLPPFASVREMPMPQDSDVVKVISSAETVIAVEVMR